MKNIVEKIVISVSIVGLAFAALVNVHIGIKAKEHKEEMAVLELERQKQHAAFEESMQAYVQDVIQTNNVIATNHLIEREAPYIPYDEEYENWKEIIVPVWGNTCNEDFSDFLIIESDVDMITAEYTEQYLALIPDYILDAIIELGWHMELTSSNLAEENGFDPATITIGGVTSFDDKSIRIQANERSISLSVIHEIGHVIDYEFLEDILDKNGYKDLTNETFQNFYLHGQGTSYLYELRDELVAELFVEYIFYPREFKAQDKGLFTIYDGLESIINRKN